MAGRKPINETPLSPAERKRRSREAARMKAIYSDDPGELSTTQIAESLPFLVAQGGVSQVSEFCRVLIERARANIH